MGFFSNLFGSAAPKQDLGELIQKGAFLVDVRSPGEFASGSAKGAVNIPLDKIPASIEHFKNKEHIIVFCRSGNRSGQALSILKQNGIANVYNGGTVTDIQSAL